MDTIYWPTGDKPNLHGYMINQMDDRSFRHVMVNPDSWSGSISSEGYLGTILLSKGVDYASGLILHYSGISYISFFKTSTGSWTNSGIQRVFTLDNLPSD